MVTVNDIAIIENVQTGEVIEYLTELRRLQLLEVVVPGLQGAKGDKGDSGGESGQPRFVGAGEPGTIVGANPGDRYLDTLTGNIYRLD